MEFVDSIDGVKLKFEDSPKTQGIKEVNEREFILCGSSETWLNILELTEPFEHDAIGCHQYLVDSGDLELIFANGRGW